MKPGHSDEGFDYDVVVVGAGPGGYVAAIRAAQLGLKTACVEKRETLGGTCLNVGCIPSKSLLHASEHYEKAASGALSTFGVQLGSVSLDLDKMMAEKDKAVSELTGGISYLFKKNEVTHIVGTGKITEPHQVTVGSDVYTAKDIVIATGSSPTILPGIELNDDTVVDSTGALSFGRVPEHLVVIGAGVIGLELGSVWNRLGADVTVLEFQDSFLSTMDADISKEALKIFTAQGLDVQLGHEVTSVVETSKGQQVLYKSRQTGEEKALDVSHVLVASGRRPHTDGLGLAELGMRLDDHGRILTNDRFETSVPAIWAVGDVTPGPMLAHRAEDEGIAVAETIAGMVGLVNHAVIPNVVYTDPEIASVGLTEAEAAETYPINVGMFPFVANSRAKSNRDTSGFVKIVTEAEDDTVVGVHIIGTQAGNMIAQAAQAMEFGATAQDIAYTCHAHPTHAEALKEAAMSVSGQPIHM